MPWLVFINQDFRMNLSARSSITPNPRVPSGTGSLQAGPGGAEPSQLGSNPGHAEASEACTDLTSTRILQHLLCQRERERTPLSHSHFLSASVRPALFIATTPGFGRELACRCTRPLSRPQRIFQLSRLSPAVRRSQKPAPTPAARTLWTRLLQRQEQGRDGDTVAPPPAKSPTFKKIAVLFKITLQSVIASPFLHEGLHRRFKW